MRVWGSPPSPCGLVPFAIFMPPQIRVQRSGPTPVGTVASWQSNISSMTAASVSLR